MAQLDMQMTVRFAWWFYPYLTAVKWALWLWAPFASDEAVDRFIERTCAFGFRHGVSFNIGGRQA